MSKTVLVVDDSTPVRQQVGLALTLAGYKVVEAFDGQPQLELRIGGQHDASRPNRARRRQFEVREMTGRDAPWIDPKHARRRGGRLGIWSFRRAV